MKYTSFDLFNENKNQQIDPKISLLPPASNAFSSKSANMCERDIFTMNSSYNDREKQNFKKMKELKDLDKKDNNYLDIVPTFQRRYAQNYKNSYFHRVCFDQFCHKNYAREAHVFNNKLEQGKQLSLNEFNDVRHHVKKSSSVANLNDTKSNNNNVKTETAASPYRSNINVFSNNRYDDEPKVIKELPLINNKLVIDKTYDGKITKHAKGFWKFIGE